MAEDSTSKIELGNFMPLLGKTFTLKLEDQEWPAELSEAEAIPNHNPDPDREPFSLSFKAEAAKLPQASYEVTHSSLPSLQIFLVPIAGDSSRTTLQAIFN